LSRNYHNEAQDPGTARQRRRRPRATSWRRSITAMRPQAFYASPFKKKISTIFSTAIHAKTETAILILFSFHKINK